MNVTLTLWSFRFMWTTATPNRDCAFDAGVIIHEYTHGVSNRLTGGPANTNCLNVLEAGGMGEGWGDAMAIFIHVKTNDTRATNYPLGDVSTLRPQTNQSTDSVKLVG
jgi:extracellular elastinolytic metalloproteinase